MEKEELIKKIEEIESILPNDTNQWTGYITSSFFITTLQFVKNYIGVDSEFYSILSKNKGVRGNSATSSTQAWAARKVLKSIKDYLNLDLDIHKNEKYVTKVDVINDFMEQAVILNTNKKFHPAAAGILLGASLEEFLKRLAELHKIELDGEKLSIDTISKKLYAADILKKQDIKDITSWAGIRNDATHGEFEQVNDSKRIQNAIEGINLFMRKYNP